MGKTGVQLLRLMRSPLSRAQHGPRLRSGSHDRAATKSTPFLMLAASSGAIARKFSASSAFSRGSGRYSANTGSASGSGRASYRGRLQRVRSHSLVLSAAEEARELRRTRESLRF